MNLNQLKEYDSLAQKHWWLVSKYNVLVALIQKYVDFGDSQKILDIGSAGGAFLDRLKPLTPQRYALDINPDILNYLKEKDPTIITQEGEANSIPFPDHFFNVIFFIDVLEHLDDDLGALQEINRILKEDGYMEISVPAFNCLFGTHDTLYGHKRRYTRKELKNKLEESGFVVEKLSYIQPLFFAPLWIKRKIFPTDTENGDFSETTPWLNSILTKILTMEKDFLNYIDFPIGATLLGVCKKRRV